MQLSQNALPRRKSQAGLGKIPGNDALLNSYDDSIR